MQYNDELITKIEDRLVAKANSGEIKAVGVKEIIDEYRRFEYEFYKDMWHKERFSVEKTIAEVKKNFKGNYKSKNEIIRYLNILLSHAKTDSNATNAPTYTLNLNQKQMTHIYPKLYGKYSLSK